MFGGDMFGPFYPLPQKKENTATEDYQLQLKWVKVVIFESKEYKALLKRIKLLEQELEEIRKKMSERDKIKETVVKALVSVGMTRRDGERIWRRVIEEYGYHVGEDELLRLCMQSANLR